jgi:hypothetical protein
VLASPCPLRFGCSKGVILGAGGATAIRAFCLGHPPSDPALYNVKDSVNYQFGAKAYPTASPTLRLPRAAAVLLTAP